MGRRWPDAPLAGSVIKATDIILLRRYIDEDLGAIGHTYPWTWFNLDDSRAPHPAPVLAKYFTEMRGAIQELWDSKSRPALPNWTSGIEPGGPSNPPSRNRTPTLIRASDIADLRLWLNLYEDNHAQSQGIDTLSYDVNETGQPITHQGWTDDIFKLKKVNPLYARCVINSPKNASGNTQDPSTTDLARFASVFRRYRAKEIDVYPLYGLGFYSNDSQNPSAAFDSGQFSNQYIRTFAQKLRPFYDYIRENTSLPLRTPVSNVIIWNEPNVNTVTLLPASHFASLLYTCYQTLPSTASIYWGGIKFGPGSGDNPDGNTLKYIRDVHEELKTRQLVGGNSPWPWSGINVHIHGEQASNDQFAKMRTELDSIRYEEYPGTGYLFVGEWGVQRGTYQNNPDRLNELYGLIRGIGADAMFYYSHHDHRDPNDPSTNARWGIRDITLVDSPPGTPYPDNTVWFAPGGYSGQPVGTPPIYLWQKFDLLMGQ